ncbi:PAAR domain-containing protein [Proteus sp. G2618]|uniref:PAAR domain-containing protein n=1 Tax=Proteus TaxID=583 RepID=UPI000D68D58C|nr:MULTISPECIES: PAAR domain-containing protein [Proteus]MBG5951700.1 PAAR domain-containing protein [Proteus terrae]MCE9839687.1 PAAR domain-containing protein [Proteus terrae]MCT8263521.1 PAAR domain-containing protein [Proteus terrae]NBN69623.1 PAAR domain-containing protein [Proteus sp. G2618]QIG05270.1 PAAR domain-containing protein [Proteus sp. ZN5]
MKKIIRVGDTLNPYGGKVITGSYLAYGKSVACVGDKVICNKHGENRIIEGAKNSTINKRAVALEGHHCACGCTLVSSLSNISIKS